MAYKRLEEQEFTLPAVKDGLMTLSHAQFEALFSGLDWRRVRAVEALKAMLVAAALRDQRNDERIAQLEKLVAAFKQVAFGRRPEKSDPDQFELALEDLETAIAAVHAEEDAEDRAARRPAKRRSANRGSLPKHLPRIEKIIEPKPGLWLRRRSALHWRGRLRAARRDPGPVPGNRHSSSQVCLPVLHRWRGAGAGSGSADPGWAADRGHGRPCPGQQISRSSPVLSPGADLQPPGY